MNEVETIIVNNRKYIYYNIKEFEDNISITVVVKVGSMSEKVSEKGYSHFLEHILLSFDKLNQDAQIHCRGYTDFYYTYYTFYTTNNMLNKCIVLIEKFFTGRSITDANMDYVREDILDEYYRLKKGYVNKEFKYLLSGTKYMEHLPIGDLITIKTCSSENIKRYYLKHYKSESVSMIILGNIKKNLVYEKSADRKIIVNREKNIFLPLVNKNRIIHINSTFNGMQIYFYREKHYRNRIAYVMGNITDEIIFSMIETITYNSISKVRISNTDEFICLKIKEIHEEEDMNKVLEYIFQKISIRYIKNFIEVFKGQFSLNVDRGFGINLVEESFRCIEDIIYNGEVLGNKEIRNIAKDNIKIITAEEIFVNFKRLIDCNLIYRVLESK